LPRAPRPYYNANIKHSKAGGRPEAGGFALWPPPGPLLITRKGPNQMQPEGANEVLDDA